MNILIHIVVRLLDVAMKGGVAWITWLICGYFNLPEWAMLTLVIMSVQSTHFHYTEITV